MNQPVVLVEQRGPVATVTLNRPLAMNALSTKLRLELSRCFRELVANAAVRVVILTGAGRAFCAAAEVPGRADWTTAAKDSTSLRPSATSKDR